MIWDASGPRIFLLITSEFCINLGQSLISMILPAIVHDKYSLSSHKVDLITSDFRLIRSGKTALSVLSDTRYLCWCLKIFNASLAYEQPRISSQTLRQSFYRPAIAVHQCPMRGPFGQNISYPDSCR